jgi:glycosyltransferase involved in cell wall biosynthesis
VSVRVAMVIAQYPPVIGGVERACERLSAALARRGLAVHVLTRRPPGAAATEVKDDVTIHRVDVPEGRVAAGSLFILRALAWLVRHRADIIHCHQALSPATIGALARLLTRRPVIVKLAGSGPTGDMHQAKILPFTALRRVLLRRVSGFVCPSAQIAAELTEFLGPVRHWVVGNAIDTAHFAPLAAAEREALRARLGITGRALVFAGQLRPEKNLALAVSALAQLPEDVRLYVVGDGPERGPALAIAEKLEVARRVHFFGAVPDTAPYLQAADALVLPSVSEGMSNALLEAMSTALPVLASDIEGNRALIDQTTGLLFGLDAGELARAALTAFEDPGLTRSRSEAARARVVATHDLTAVAARYEQIYAELLA